MNKILRLFDEQYVKELFEKEILPLYPDFKRVKRIKIIPHKDHVWEHTYHVVIEFKTAFSCADGKTRILPIFCSAHSDEPRKNVYRALDYLWKHSFGNGYLSIPHPLFYSDYFKGTFYRGVNGNNLYQFIRSGKRTDIEATVPKAAAWFAKLHRLPTAGAENFNEENSRVATVFPGIGHILDRVREHYPEHYAVCERMLNFADRRENEFFASTDRRWLIHGDAHPENVIKMSAKKLAMIDFTDICLSDFARDLGAFTEQLDYMINRKVGDREYADKIKRLFLDSYFERSKEKPSPGLDERIAIYYHWTAIRTATYFLLKYNQEPERARPVLDKVETWLKERG